MKIPPKKLLAIFPQLPLPQFAGDRQKVHNLVKILSRNYELTVVIICRDKPKQEDYFFLSQNSASYKIFYLSRLTILTNLIKGILRREALQIGFFYNEKIQKSINDLSNDKDLVFCNLIRVAKYAEKLEKPKFIDIVDSLSISYKRSLEKVQSIFWKQVYKYEYKHLKIYEAKIMQNFNASFLVNYIEQQYWAKKIVHKPIVWLPQGIKEELFSYEKIEIQYANSIMFIGKMDYQPNVDAVNWFLRNVWPLINESVDFYIVGVNPPDFLLQLVKNDKRVKFMGYMSDPYLIMKSCKAVVSPMQTGGGVQNKILEGMALSKVNVTTSLGAKSIRFAENLKHFLVVDDASQMAYLINDILINSDKYKMMEEQAKRMVRETYTWANFEKQLISAINKSL
jgi:glycosyltransferase involved in cell wall biosynthesis